MKADIFIPTSRSTTNLKICLDSLTKQTNNHFRTIIVALDDSQKIRELLKQYPIDIEFVVQKEPGLVHAANIALQHAKNEVFIRIDDDVLLDVQWLDAILETFKDGSVGGVTGPTIIKQELQKRRDLFYYLNSFRQGKNLFFTSIYKVYIEYIYEGKIHEVSQFLRSGAFTLGSNMENIVSKIHKNKAVTNLEACNFAVRTELLREYGGFDTVFSKGLSEYHEADVACKIRQHGHTLVFNPKAKVWHNVGRSSGVRADTYGRIQNFIIFYRRHIKVDSLDKICRFGINVLLQNAYYLYLFFRTGDWSVLGVIPGTVVGFFRKYE